MIARVFLILVALIGALHAADYTVPGTTVVLPLIDDLQGDAEIQGVFKAGEGFPRIAVSVIRKLDRERVLKEPAAYTAVINGVEFEFSESTRDKGGRKFAVIMAGANIEGQGLTIVGLYEADNAKHKEVVTKTIMAARFGKKLITSFMDALPVTFDVLPELDVVTTMSGGLQLAGKDESVGTAKGMTITAMHQELAADEKDAVLKAMCHQVAEKIWSVKPDDGKLEKTTLGVMSGYRFTINKSAAGKLQPGVIYALNKDGITVAVMPSRESGPAEMALFTKQVTKMKSTLKLRK